MLLLNRLVIDSSVSLRADKLKKTFLSGFIPWCKENIFIRIYFVVYKKKLLHFVKCSSNRNVSPLLKKKLTDLLQIYLYSIKAIRATIFMIEKCSSVTSFIHIFWKNSSHALVEAKLPTCNCNPANVRIDLHISYIYMYM